MSKRERVEEKIKYNKVQQQNTIKIEKVGRKIELKEGKREC